ncbi:MAG: GNAT family N-acetyltransferase [Bacteroidetes bacterium]|nr:MAG: GNAT family N-acetyltransferase [Bacteroidota bacterium]
MSDLRIEIIPHGSEQYEASVALRDKVLRQPLGLQFSEEELAKESDQIHVIASVDDALIGVLVLVPIGPKTYKMRQVAVAPEWQGKGIGTRLVSFSEEYAIRKGVCCIELHARKEAVQFYLDLAYTKLGDEFVEVGIPHFKMEKNWCAQ